MAHPEVIHMSGQRPIPWIWPAWQGRYRYQRITLYAECGARRSTLRRLLASNHQERALPLTDLRLDGEPRDGTSGGQVGSWPARGQIGRASCREKGWIPA